MLMETKKKNFILLVLIISLGFFLRFWNIDNAPPGVYPDEAVNGIDALSALQGHWQWFYEANNGREGLFMNLIALFFYFFGISVFTLKLPAIIFGTLTALGTFLLSRELFSSRRIALISSFLVATSFWAINFSRISFRANMLPFVLAFSFYFLLRGLRTKRMIDFMLGGLFFGLGLHTYIAFRIAPLILLAMFFTLLLTRKSFLKEFWKQLAMFFVSMLIIASPMIYTFYKHPGYISSRTGNVSVLNPEINNGHLVTTFFRSFGLSIVKYNLWGDQNWRHNYPPYPILDPITGVAFTFGLTYCLFRLARLLYLGARKRLLPRELETYMFLISWFFIMLAPEFMTAEGNPHALRSIGTLPVVFIIAAMTFGFLIRQSENYTPLFKKISVFFMATMLITIGLFNSLKYHYFWANKKETAQSFNNNLMEISDHVRAVPKETQLHIVAESMQRIPIQLFNWERPNTSYYYPGEIDQINQGTDDYEIILTDYDDNMVNYLQNKFPQIKITEEKDRFGLSYYILK